MVFYGIAWRFESRRFYSFDRSHAHIQQVSISQAVLLEDTRCLESSGADPSLYEQGMAMFGSLPPQAHCALCGSLVQTFR